MLIFEFAAPDPLLIHLVAVIGQLKSSIDSGTENPEWTVDELLEYLKDNDIIIDKADLFDMIKGPPLNRSIGNIQGDNIIFKGQDSDVTGEPEDHDENKKIVKQMAKRAAN